MLQIISPLFGGGEAFFYNVIRKMNDKGHKIDIICYREGKIGLLTQELMRKGVNIHSIKPEIDDKGIVLTYSQQLRYIVNAIRKGIQIIKTKNIDIIHANTYTPIIPAVVLGRVSRIPVICTCTPCFTWAVESVVVSERNSQKYVHYWPSLREIDFKAPQSDNACGQSSYK